nr:Protein Y56A3A.16, isoform b [Haemonchus contortus]
MERILSRKQELDDQIDDMVEVDKISFTSFASSDDGDLRMSVQQSPIPSTFSDFKTASELSLHCQHRSRSSSESELTTNSPSCSRVDTSCPIPTPSSSTVNQDIISGSLPKTFPTPSSFCIDHGWINNLYVTNELPPSMEIVPQEPYWKEMEQEFIALRQRDANISKDLEESNMYMYSLRLSLAAIEEARWLNDVSEDPELSRLVHETDSKFPLAVHRIPKSMSTDQSSAENMKEASGDYSPDRFCPPFEIKDDDTIRPSIFRSMRRPNRRHRLTRGTVAGSPSRKPEVTWSEVASSVLESFSSRETLRDERVSHWMDDLVRNTDRLLSLPTTSQSISEEEHGRSSSRSTAEPEWTPPQETWIYTLWKGESMFSSVKVLLEAQNYRCFGCGIRVEKEYIKRVKYCDYYGKVFCQCCHQGSKSIIPARILHTWNFNEFPVCDLALHFLLEVRDVPSIHVNVVAPQMVEKIRVLKHVIVLREKLSYMWDFVKECPDAENTETKIGHLRTLFTSMEQHLLHSQDLFSLSDLVRVHNKDMSSHLEPIAHYAKCHIESCEHCRQFAATCVYCGDDNELLFSFQMEKVHKYFDGMSSSSKSPSVPSDKSKPSVEGFQEKHSIAKKKITSGSNTPVSSSNVDVTELMKALRVVRRAKEKNRYESNAAVHAVVAGWSKSSDLKRE